MPLVTDIIGFQTDVSGNVVAIVGAGNVLTPITGIGGGGGAVDFTALLDAGL